jgi:hypothetical protein
MYFLHLSETYKYFYSAQHGILSFIIFCILFVCGTHGGGKKCKQGFIGRLKRMRPLGRPRHRWEDNIKMDVREIGIYGANWIQLTEDGVQW